MSEAELTNVLVRHFTQSYFRVGQQPTNNAYPIVRWPDKISIDIFNPQLLPEGVRDHAHDITAALRGAGFDVALNASQSDSGNVSIIIFDATDGFSSEDLGRLKRHMSGNAEALDYFVKQFDEKPTCFMGGAFSGSYRLRSAFAAINANLPGAVIRRCLGTMISGIVGFQGYVSNGVVSRSIFSDSEALSDLSDWDHLAFRMLADNRLQPGMTYDQEMQNLLRAIAGELIAAWPQAGQLEAQLKAY